MALGKVPRAHPGVWSKGWKYRKMECAMSSGEVQSFDGGFFFVSERYVVVTVHFEEKIFIPLPKPQHHKAHPCE
jgi:hypothetical protein